MENEYLVGNALEVLSKMPDESVQCCLTSPPYFLQRDYGLDPVIFDPPEVNCFHEWEEYATVTVVGGMTGAFDKSTIFTEKEARAYHEATGSLNQLKWEMCANCGAERGHLGAELTPMAFVRHLGEIFREVKRVLKKDGVLWINIDDTYQKQRLLGIPWRLVFELENDGWILRSDNVWNKVNTTPENVSNRPTRTHEPVFQLVKNKKYKCNTKKPLHRNPTGNLRSVWSLATANYGAEHYAAFPHDLVKIAVLSSTDEGDVVLDPFAGSGTTCAIAAMYNRKWIGIDASPEYEKLAQDRINEVEQLKKQVTIF